MSVTLRAVTHDEAEIRLDRWFRRHFPGLTQGAIEKFCRTGQVRVDGHRVEAATHLQPGQIVRVPPLPALPDMAKKRPIDPRVRDELEALVLYRDEQMLVLNKPYGLPVQGGPGISRHLDGMLGALSDGEHRPRLVHRLDRDTSGVLLLARTPGTAGKLAALFRGRDIQKTYWAVVVGRPMPLEGRIDALLTKIGGPRGERTAIADKGDEDAVRAVTDYQTLDSAARKLSWLELSPLTGRTHQLRVHCEAIGTPILGDPKYGDPFNPHEELSDQLHLHARTLKLPHPAGGTLEVSAPLPPHMRNTFSILGFTAPATPKPVRR
jgi:23S rRNA pseudouridine955/2504/2580 synthase